MCTCGRNGGFGGRAQIRGTTNARQCASKPCHNGAWVLRCMSRALPAKIPHASDVDCTSQLHVLFISSSPPLSYALYQN